MNESFSEVLTLFASVTTGSGRELEHHGNIMGTSENQECEALHNVQLHLKDEFERNGIAF